MSFAVIIGSLGADPEVKIAASGLDYVQFSVCTNRKVKRGDNWVKVAEWFKLAAFGNNAKFLGMYGAKGAKVYARCTITVNEWTDKAGTARKDVQFVVDEWLAIHSKTATAPAVAGNDSQDGGEDSDIPF